MPRNPNYPIQGEFRGGRSIITNLNSIRNALDRARLRQANRLFEQDGGPLNAEALSRIEAADIAASRVFAGADPEPASAPG